MRRRPLRSTFELALALGLAGHEAGAQPPSPPSPTSAADAAALAFAPRVQGTDLTAVEVGDSTRRSFHAMTWDDLARTRFPAGAQVVRFQVAGGDRLALEVPHCAGRARVLVDGVPIAAPPGPVVTPLVARPAEAHEIEIEVTVSGYEHRIACGAAPRFGLQVPAHDGLATLRFASPQAAGGGGTAVVFIPPGHDIKKPGAVLLGAHPWNGTPWTYAAYAELLREATARDVVLLMPSGLGNSLYVTSAEDEVLRALDALGTAVAIDPQRVSIWGASMGGAGATTIGLHHPDRFATVTSFFGDARYDLTTYVRSILRDEAGAHTVNALDVVDNARHLPVWLIHGEADRVSPIAQSVILARALEERHFTVRFDRVPGMGHEGALVVRMLPGVVARAAEARAPLTPPRVTFRSVRPQDVSAYGVRIVRAGLGDALVDVERRADGVHVLRAAGVRAVELARGALGTPVQSPPPLVLDVPSPSERVEVRWAAPDR